MLLTSIAIMITGVATTLYANVIVALVGLVVATARCFGAHTIASGWTARPARIGTAQASSLYNLFYYAGSSVIGWLGGLAFDKTGWTALASTSWPWPLLRQPPRQSCCAATRLSRLGCGEITYLLTHASRR